MLSPAPDPAITSWNSVEVWIDPFLSPPYILMLLSNSSGNCRIYDPAEGYRIVFEASSYDDAQAWLLEDEYELLEGKLLASDFSN
jgi:hypothetical protein